jgi:outer membrane receptor protein involved in Fe transport
MVRAPEWTANFRASHTVPMLSGETTFTGSVSYASKFISNNPSTFATLATATVPANTNTRQRWFNDGFTLLNLQAAWRAPGDHLTLTAYVNNATDKRYPITTNGSALGSYRQFSEPRTFGLRAAYAF